MEGCDMVANPPSVHLTSLYDDNQRNCVNRKAKI
ncbi:hypothetical protein Bhyg_10014 [Pseudolycoriella hygida]|uniref:Uncharacterized protein n=1 Tax=Pseudolycoriella hygida TaxID=35572 RepID=A0A9Q0MUF3_9DIPT|nr:hypothetical protein Bhyg_10014 [Pseudolycoriella hygida]